jgi:hypothetical protein
MACPCTQVLKRPPIAAVPLTSSSSAIAPTASAQEGLQASTHDSSLVASDSSGDSVASARRQELLDLKLSELQKLASSLGVPAEQVEPH